MNGRICTAAADLLTGRYPPHLLGKHEKLLNRNKNRSNEVQDRGGDVDGKVYFLGTSLGQPRKESSKSLDYK